MKHTPGPWTFHQNGDGSYSILGKKLSEKEYQWIVGFIQNGEILTEEQIANAKLVAEAPLMLEILQELVKDHEAETRDTNKEFDTYWTAKQLIQKLEK